MPPTYHGSDIHERLAFELIHIRSDQKVQCDPGESGLCLFAVIFDEGDISSHLIVYPKAQNEDDNVFFGVIFMIQLKLKEIISLILQIK